MEPGIWKLDGNNSGKAEVLVSVIDRYLALLTDTVTVSSLARNQCRDAEVAEGARETDVRRQAQRLEARSDRKFLPPGGGGFGCNKCVQV